MSLNDGDRILDIAVIGCGIGGAATAVALAQAGCDIEVYEQASELREIGGPLIVRDASMMLLAQWGVLAALKPKMVAVREIEMRDETGTIQSSISIRFAEGESDVAYSVHRADVHNALLAGIAPERLHLSHRLASITHHEGFVEARFENGATIRARVIVGADGIRSRVRAYMDDGPMAFVKMVTHRTIAPAALLPADMPNDRLRLWRKGRLVAITLPIRGKDEVAIDAAIPTERPPENLWSAASEDELLAAYAGFDPLLATLIRGRTVDVTTHPVYDKDPITRWTDGRIVLLGDAAHPMTPMQGQGANQAIQDAGALADALQDADVTDPAAALERYQAVRAPIANHFQLMSRKPPQPIASPSAS